MQILNDEWKELSLWGKSGLIPRVNELGHNSDGGLRRSRSKRLNVPYPVASDEDWTGECDASDIETSNHARP